ncbi:MAG: LamG domain-containing protein, partial [Candidatus Nomurabacteria bacterium]|nr:LamG domain-containing protein [Candidatus Nomurabacteria bacterium]
GTGVLTADSNTITLVGAGTVFTITGTLNANTSTVNYTCITGAETVAGTTYYNLGVGTTSDVAAAITYTLASATTVNNTLTIGNAGSTNTDIFSASTFVLTLAASSTTAWNVTAKGSIATTNSTINYTATSATTVRSMTYYALGVGTTLDSSAVVYTLGGATTVTNVITIGNAGSGANDTLNGSSYTLTVSYTGNPFTVTAHGLFDGSSGTVEYAGNVAMTVSALTYYNLTIDPTLTAARAYTGAGAITATGAFMFNPTASSAYVLTLTLGGTLSVTGTTTITKASNATSVLDTKAANSYALTTGVLTINAGGTLIGNGSTITDSGTFTNAGTYTGTSANSLLVTGNFTNSGTISSIGLVTLNKQSDASATITSGGAMLPSLTINATGSTYTLQDNLTVLGNLTLTAGTFDVSSNNRTLNLGGIWNNAGGTLNARAGSVNITGANGASSTITTNAQSFYNLSTTATADGFSKLLMHDEGANGSTTFTDSSLSNTTLTAAGGAQIATAQHQFGSSAAAFDGVATSMITAPTNDTDFDFGSGDFTIETWVKTNGGTGYEGLLSLTVANGGSFANNSFYFCVNAAGGIDIAITAGASWNVNMSSAGVTVRDGTWHHVAVTRYNGKFDTWIDGTSRANVTPTAFSINAAANRHLFVGRHPEQATLKGWMDETRISKGHARYTTTFTPTTTGFVIPTASLSSNTDPIT